MSESSEPPIDVALFRVLPASEQPPRHRRPSSRLIADTAGALFGKTATGRRTRRRRMSSVGGAVSSSGPTWLASESSLFRAGTCPLSPAELLALGLAQVPLNLEWYRGEAYILQVDEMVPCTGTGTGTGIGSGSSTFHNHKGSGGPSGAGGLGDFAEAGTDCDALERQRDVHVLGATEELLRAGAEAAMALVARFDASELEELHVRTVFHLQAMGRESAQFEKYFQGMGNFLVYFDGPLEFGFRGQHQRQHQHQQQGGHAASYAPRLLRVRPPDRERKTGLSRVVEVARRVGELAREDGFVLDVGSAAYAFQKDGKARALLAARLLVRALASARDADVACREVDDDFWALIDGHEGEGAKAGFAQVKEAAEAAAEAEDEDEDEGESARLKSIWVATEKGLERVSLGRRLSRLDVAEDESVFVVDAGDQHVFVYKASAAGLFIARALELAQQFAKQTGASHTPSVSLVSSDACSPFFDEAFAY